MRWLLGSSKNTLARALETIGAGSAVLPPNFSDPENVTPPAIPAGSYTEGDQIDATAGVWTGSPTPSIERRWQYRPDGGAWTTIEGETGLTPVIPTGIAGSDLRMQEQGTNSQNTSAWVTSNTVGPVAALPVAPSFDTAPSISPSTGEQGQLYDLILGTWSGTTPITADWTLTHSVLGDITGSVVGGQYDSTGQAFGTLTLTVSLTNPATGGTPIVATDTATVTEASVPAGPLKQALSAGAPIGVEANSQGITITGASGAGHGGDWYTDATARTFAINFVEGGSWAGVDNSGSISASIWDADGAGRNADLTGGALWTNNAVAPNQYETGFPAPGSAQDTDSLRYLSGFARAAIAAGAAELTIVANWPHRDYPDYDAAMQIAQWWRAHAAMHNPGIDVWVFPAAYMVRDLRADIQSQFARELYVDPVHLDNVNNPTAIQAMSRAAEAFSIRAQHPAYNTFSTLLRQHYDICWNVLQTYRWAGFGGTEAPDDLLYNGAPLSEANDPLPDPGLLPGEGGSAPTIPTAPSVTLDATSDEGFTLSWTFTDDGGAAITRTDMAYRLAPSGTATNIADITSPYEQTGLDADTEYQYRIRGLNSVGWGEWSDWTSVTTDQAAPTGPTRVMEITEDPYAGPTLTGTLPAASGGYRTFTTGAAPVLSAALAVSDQVHIVAAIRLSNPSAADIHLIAALHAGNPVGAPHVHLLVNGYVNQFSAVLNTTEGGATAEGANFGGYSEDVWIVVDETVDVDTVRAAVDGVDGAAPVTNGDITGWTTTQIALFASASGASMTVDVAALGIYDAALDATERATARAWAQGRIPT